MEIEIKVGVTTIRGYVERARGLATDFDGPGKILVGGTEGPSAVQFNLAMGLTEQGRPDRQVIEQALALYRASPKHKEYIADVERGARGNLHYLRDRLLGMSLIGDPFRVPLEAWRHADGRVEWTLRGLLPPSEGVSIVMTGLWVPDESLRAQATSLAQVCAAVPVIPSESGRCSVQLPTGDWLHFLSSEAAFEWLFGETFMPLQSYSMEEQASAMFRAGIHLATQSLGALNSWVNGDSYRAVASTRIGKKVTAERRLDALEGEAAAVSALYSIVAELHKLAA